MNRIVLWDRYVSLSAHPSTSVDVSVSLKELAAEVSRLGGQWRIVRRDSWVYDERVVGALIVLSGRPGVELVDPTGLIGGSTHPDLHPAARPNTGSLTSRRSTLRAPTEPPTPRKPHRGDLR